MHQAQRADGARAVLGLCRYIVDLVQTGSTLKANASSRSSASPRSARASSSTAPR